MKKPAVPFDLTETPLLKARNLVEASAGTGKTYAITALFLRLILEQDLSVSEILVVTYTEAATEELRHRIRQTLSLALQGFTEGRSEIDFLQTLITRHHGAREEMIARLESGLRNFDESAICTIHGFCQRSLKDRAFESGLHFDTELLPDARPILSEIAEDYWRKKFYRTHPLQVAVALKNNLGPAELLRLLHVAKAHHQLRILPQLPLDDLGRREQHLLETFFTLGQIWNSEKPAIKSLFGGGIRWGNAPYNRDSEMEVSFQELDHCFSQTEILFEALHCLNDFCPSSMEKKRSKKGKEALPDHPFFKACEKFCQVEKEFLTGLKIDFLKYAQPELARRTAERKVQTFDELLVRLDHALHGAAGETLALQLRKKYPATLIDEFQDTDPVQYSIFRRIFGKETFLYLIGDPKQAIYGFRGADIYTYLKAVAEAENRFTLLDNWRSETRLVGGLNALFSLSSNPFVFQNIEFHAVKARGRADAAPLQINGRRGASLVVWFHSSPEKGISKAAAEHTLPQVVASEIVTLLEGSATLGGRKLRPEDIAVVVRKNKQARWIQESLRERNVPSVLHTDESVFVSAEAEEIRRVLLAVSQPSNEPIVRAALVTDFLGHNGSEIYEMNQQENLWRQTVEPFHHYRELWIRNGFFRMFRLMLQDRQVRQRLLSFEDGERRLTNVLHLAELLHQASETFSSPRALVDWLGRQQNSEAHDSEDHPLRLERDENAVRLVTIHKAKGLEYGVVFCPFGWEGTELRGGDPVLFHDETDGTHTLDLGGPDLDRHKQQALTEQLAENIRMLYVSLTRARHRSYLTWGRFNGASTSAPAWLLHTPAPPAENPVSSVQSDFQTLDDAALRQRLDELVHGSLSEEKEPGVLLCHDPGSSTSVFTEGGNSKPLFQPRAFKGSIDRSWGIASFSSLTMAQHDESPDYDSPGWNQELQPQASGIFAFPRGTRPGTCLHKIFELLDYQDPEMVRSVVGDQLRAHGYLEDHLCQTVTQTVEKVLSVPLDVSRDEFRLSSISRSERLAEWEFHFPLSKVSSQDIRNFFARHHFENQFVDQTQPRLDFDPVQGWMKGFIDLVFRFDGRFYLVDWKSNWLGNQPEDYSENALRLEMTQRKYYFQFIIYCLALDQYLRLRLPGYDYQEHFGGVRYIFLRGVDPARPELGIFRDRPGPDLMDDLRNLLIRKNL